MSLLLLTVISTACVTTNDSVNDSVTVQEDTEPAYATWRDLRSPITHRLDLPVEDEAVRKPSPSPDWLPGELPYWVWLPESADGSLLFLGTSFPMVSRESEVETCIENAARQAAQYAGIAAVVSSFQVSLNGETGYAEDIRLFYNQNIIPMLISEAEIRTMHQNDTGSYGLIRFPSLMALPGSKLNSDMFSSGKAVPGWINTLPPLDSHFIGLGLSRPKIRFADSIATADEAAVAEILTQMATTVDVAADVRQSSGKNGFTEKNYQYSTAMIRGVRVIARWRDPDMDYFYSLAVLPRP